LVDEYATDNQVQRLEKLLLENEDARRTYMMCMQMHADLHFLLSGEKSRLAATLEELIEAETAAQSPQSPPGKKAAQGAKGSPTSLPLADLPVATPGVPHSNGLSH
jgi:hypothetical protein